MSLLPFSETTNLTFSDELVLVASVVDVVDVSVDVVDGWNVVGDVVGVTTLSRDVVEEVSTSGVVSIGSVRTGINSTRTAPSVEARGGSTTVVGERLTSYSVVLDPSSTGKIIEGSFSAGTSGKSLGYKRENSVSGSAVVASSSFSVTLPSLVLPDASWTVCESTFQLHRLLSKLQSS